MHGSKCSNTALPDPTGHQPAYTVSELMGLGKRLLRRVQVLVALVAACALFIVVERFGVPETAVSRLEWLAVTVIMISMYLMWRNVKRYVHVQMAHVPAAVRGAQLKSASAVSDAFRHVVGNKLAITVARSELLMEDATASDPVREQATLIYESSLEIGRSLHALDGSRLDLDNDTKGSDAQLLDLGASELQ